MARVRPRSSGDDHEPELVALVDEARSKLTNRVRIGHELLAALSTIVDEAQLETIRSKVWTWEDYNKELLRSLFHYPDRILWEYTQGPGIHFVGLTPDPLPVRIADARDDLNRSIRRLDSIIERLELFPRAATSSGPPGAQVESRSAPRTIHITVERGSNVSNIVFGSQVDKIESNINASRGVSGDELAQALKEITEACTAAVELAPEQQTEALQLIEYLSAEASAPAEQQRPAVLRTTIRALAAIMTTAVTAGQAWNQWAPVIEQAFHLAGH